MLLSSTMVSRAHVGKTLCSVEVPGPGGGILGLGVFCIRNFLRLTSHSTDLKKQQASNLQTQLQMEVCQNLYRNSMVYRGTMGTNIYMYTYIYIYIGVILE